MAGLWQGGWIAQAGIGFLAGYFLLQYLPQGGWLYAAAALLLWGGIALWSWKMDILDRLTNREALASALKGEPPPGQLEMAIDAPALAAALKAKLFGQDAVCEDVAREIKRRAAKTGRTAPLGVFFFVGPPATGKTYFAKVLAEAMPNGFAPVFVEMAQHSEPHTAASLFGQAKGYAGSDKYGLLTGALRDNPRRVVILDEFEKAHREVQEKFLSAWNDGFLTETSTGEKVATVSAIFVITSNAAEREIAQLAARHEGDRESLSQACKRLLSAHFTGPVLSRVDRVFPFLPLGDEDLARLIAGQIERGVTEYGLELAAGGLDFHILLDAIRRARGSDADAREIGRIVSRAIDDELMDFKEQHRGVKRVRLSKADSGVVVASPA